MNIQVWEPRFYIMTPNKWHNTVPRQLVGLQDRIASPGTFYTDRPLGQNYLFFFLNVVKNLETNTENIFLHKTLTMRQTKNQV